MRNTRAHPCKDPCVRTVTPSPLQDTTHVSANFWGAARTLERHKQTDRTARRATRTNNRPASLK